jgi:hypothetical protein
MEEQFGKLKLHHFWDRVLRIKISQITNLFDPLTAILSKKRPNLIEFNY